GGADLVGALAVEAAVALVVDGAADHEAVVEIGRASGRERVGVEGGVVAAAVDEVVGVVVDDRGRAAGGLVDGERLAGAGAAGVVGVAAVAGLVSVVAGAEPCSLSGRDRVAGGYSLRLGGADLVGALAVEAAVALVVDGAADHEAVV